MQRYKHPACPHISSVTVNLQHAAAAGDNEADDEEEEEEDYMSDDEVAYGSSGQLHRSPARTTRLGLFTTNSMEPLQYG